MRPFEIFNARHEWNNCPDLRPWLIVELRVSETVGCFPISGECYGGNCFWISPTHPDFPATGLKKGCYIHDRHIVELRPHQFLNRRGELLGDLLTTFREYSGV